ncbi:putative NADH:ubiquinone reductase (H(+)-translocating) [Dioscorea sansibarensis]
MVVVFGMTIGIFNYIKYDNDIIEFLTFSNKKKKHHFIHGYLQYVPYGDWVHKLWSTTIRAARYIGQSFIITLSHTNRLPVTIQYPYEKSIASERFRGRIHFEFDKCIACEVCVRVCPIDLPVVDWRLEKNIKKKTIA